MLSPRNSPANADGTLSKPSTIVSRYDDLPVADPRPDLGEERGKRSVVVEDDEALDAQPLRDDRKKFRGPGCGSVVVVARDRPARDRRGRTAAARRAPPRAARRRRCRSTRRSRPRAHPSGRRCGSRTPRLPSDWSHSTFSASLRCRSRAALAAARSAPPRSRRRRRRPRRRPSRPRARWPISTRPDPGRERRHAEHAERGRRRRERRVELAQAVAGGDAVLAPAEHRAAPSRPRRSRRAATRRPAPPRRRRSTSPSSYGATYVRTPVMRPRMYGSTETKTLRTSTSPSPGSRSSSSRSSKSVSLRLARRAAPPRTISRLTRDAAGRG